MIGFSLPGDRFKSHSTQQQGEDGQRVEQQRHESDTGPQPSGEDSDEELRRLTVDEQYRVDEATAVLLSLSEREVADEALPVKVAANTTVAPTAGKCDETYLVKCDETHLVKLVVTAAPTAGISFWLLCCKYLSISFSLTVAPPLSSTANGSCEPCIARATPLLSSPQSNCSPAVTVTARPLTTKSADNSTGVGSSSSSSFVGDSEMKRGLGMVGAGQWWVGRRGSCYVGIMCAAPTVVDTAHTGDSSVEVRNTLLLTLSFTHSTYIYYGKIFACVFVFDAICGH